ncbi:MAG: hypothetical protein SGPRY_012690 [Prymnesium sp.]
MFHEPSLSAAALTILHLASGFSQATISHSLCAALGVHPSNASGANAPPLTRQQQQRLPDDLVTKLLRVASRASVELQGDDEARRREDECEELRAQLAAMQLQSEESKRALLQDEVMEKMRAELSSAESQLSLHKATARRDLAACRVSHDLL